MVDPNRKINRLTEKDIEFLDECEEEFGNRYEEDDEEFMAHCAKPISEPPIVEDWGMGHGGGGGGGRYGNRGNNDNRQRNHYDGQRNYRPWNNRRGYRNNNKHKPYGNWSENGGRDRHYEQQPQRHYEQQPQHSRNEPSRPPMNIPRGYGNFVAASKD